MKYESHPLANLFPMLPETELEALKESIQKNGQQVPIVLKQGKILDGRNRSLVCEQLGIDVETTEFEGDNIFEFIMSVNLRRRHLSDSQKAVLGTRVANMRQGERTDLEPSEHIPKVSQKEAAKMFGITDRFLRQAKKVIEKGTPEQIQSVDEGRTTITKVLREIKAKETEKNTQAETETTPSKTSDSRKGFVEENENLSCEETTDPSSDQISEPPSSSTNASSVDDPNEISKGEIIIWNYWDGLPKNLDPVSKIVAAIKFLFSEKMDSRQKSKFHGQMLDMFRDSGFIVQFESKNAPVK